MKYKQKMQNIQKTTIMTIEFFFTLNKQTKLNKHTHTHTNELQRNKKNIEYKQEIKFTKKRRKRR